jgi:hypothetical protein
VNDFGCRFCKRRGNLEFLMTHSCRNPGQDSRLLRKLFTVVTSRYPLPEQLEKQAADPS